MGTIVGLVLLAVLCPVPFKVGTGQWHVPWMDGTYEIGFVLFVIFVPWYVVLRLVDGSGALIPLAMIAFTTVFGIGYLASWREQQRRSRGRRS